MYWPCCESSFAHFSSVLQFSPDDKHGGTNKWAHLDSLPGHVDPVEQDEARCPGLDNFEELLVLGRRQRSSARSQLRIAIKDVLGTELPRADTPGLYQRKPVAELERSSVDHQVVALVRESNAGLLNVLTRRNQSLRGHISIRVGQGNDSFMIPWQGEEWMVGAKSEIVQISRPLERRQS